MQIDMILKRFEQPDESREMTLGKFEVVHLGGLTIGRATYQPGWKWSTCVGPGVGLSRCPWTRHSTARRRTIGRAGDPNPSLNVQCRRVPESESHFRHGQGGQ
jgi:hypothetical protein